MLLMNLVVRLIGIAFLQSCEWIFIPFDFQWTLMSVIYNRDSVVPSPPVIPLNKG